MTFSIVALDPDTGDLGVAVQSKFPNAGVAIPFARARVGAVASQAYVNSSFGHRGLALLELGASPEQVLVVLVPQDHSRELRQVGIVDTRGRTAAFTGARCFDWAGVISGDGYTVQGNTLAGAAVAESMAAAFTGASGSLAERLLATLAAGQAAGGDRRGPYQPGRHRVSQGAHP